MHFLLTTQNTMKPIKFDLPLNGTKIATLEQLEENLTPEILEPFRSGKLAKWLRVRNLTEQSETVEALLAADDEREVQLFKSLCELFVSEVDENDAREAIKNYKTALPSLSNAIEEPEQEHSEGPSDNTVTFLSEKSQVFVPSEPHNETKNSGKEKYCINQALLKRIGKEDHFFITGSIPKKKLDNAFKSYGKDVDEDEEELLVLYDDTLLGSAKDGFFLTNRKIYCSGGNCARKIEKTSINLDKIYKASALGISPSTLRINDRDIYDGYYNSGKAMKIFVEFLEDYLAL